MNIKVNAAEWNSLSQEQQNQISAILRNAQLIEVNDRVVPDASVAAGTSSVPAAPAGLFCKLACDTAEAAAVVACGLLTGPASGICIAAAHAAGEFCRSKC